MSDMSNMSDMCDMCDAQAALPALCRPSKFGLPSVSIVTGLPCSPTKPYKPTKPAQLNTPNEPNEPNEPNKPNELVELVRQKLHMSCLCLANQACHDEMLFVGWFDGKLGGFVTRPEKLHHHYDVSPTGQYTVKNCHFQTSLVGNHHDTIQVSVSLDQTHVLVVLVAAKSALVLLRIQHSIKSCCQATIMQLKAEFICQFGFWVGKHHFCLLVQSWAGMLRMVYDVDNLVVVDSQPAHSVSASCSHVLWIWCESVPSSTTDYSWSVQIDHQKRIKLDELAGWLVYAKAWTSSNPDQFVLLARKPNKPDQMWLFDASNNSIGLIDA